MRADMIRDAADDPDILDHVDPIVAKSEGLVSLGGKARDATQALDEDARRWEIDLADHVEAVVDGLAVDDADVAIEVDVPADCRIETFPDRLALVLENLLENAVEHGGDPASVRLVARSDDGASGGVTIRVSDDGPGIPEHELAVVAGGQETALEHGSGIGLWLVRWGVDALGGDLDWETPPDGGTTAVLRLPGGAGPAAGDPSPSGAGG
jgi:signal transduction histidine kinase